MSDTPEEVKVSKLVRLDEMLAAQRLDWTNKVKALAEDLKAGTSLHEVASFALSYRQILVEALASIASKVRTQKGKIDKLYKEKWISYYTYDYKLTDSQREKFIKSDLSDELQLHEMLEDHKDFLTGTVKTLDNMGFAIKQRMDMKQL